MPDGCPGVCAERNSGDVYVKGGFFMKKDSITIPYDEEKLAALRLYLEQKGQAVEQEMVSAVDALYASGIFVPYIRSLNIEDLSIAAPDMGGAKRANTYAKHLGTPIIISHKERAKANVVGKMTAIGEVEGRNILIVDDMIDTAGTICMAADMLMARGAKSVRAAITHPVLSGPAYDRINASALQEVIVTDTIPLREDQNLSKFTVLSVADIFADVIERVHNYKEISSIFFK